MKVFPFLNSVLFGAALIAVIVTLPLFFGCKDDAPTAAGSKVIPLRDGLQVRTFDTNAVVSATYFSELTGNSTVTMAGRYRDLQCRALMQFSLDITTITHVHSHIDSAYILLTISSRYRDTTAPLALEVHSLTRSWSTLSVNWDSLTTAPLPYNDSVVGSYNRNVVGTDTAIKIPVDTNQLHIWNDSGLCSVVLLPASGCGQIVGFEDNFTTGVKAELIVGYHDSTNTSGVSTNVATQMAFVANCALPPIAKDFYAQGGVSYRGKLFFDISGIPHNASVIAANLQLHLDTLATVRGDSSSGNVLVQNMSSDSSSPSLGGLTGNALIDSTRAFVSIPINNLAQDWVTRPATNFGVSIRLNDEFISVDRLAFYGVLAPVNLRPHLHIRYTVLQ